MINDNEFKAAAAMLKHNCDPQVWDNFIGAMRAYTARASDQVTEASLAEVVLHQGFARQCKKLMRLFDECDLPRHQRQPGG